MSPEKNECGLEARDKMKHRTDLPPTPHLDFRASITAHSIHSDISTSSAAPRHTSITAIMAQTRQHAVVGDEELSLFSPRHRGNTSLNRPIDTHAAHPQDAAPGRHRIDLSETTSCIPSACHSGEFAPLPGRRAQYRAGRVLHHHTIPTIVSSTDLSTLTPSRLVAILDTKHVTRYACLQSLFHHEVLFHSRSSGSCSFYRLCPATGSPLWPLRWKRPPR